MAYLPPMTLVAPPAPGPWVSHEPLWANPALCENRRTLDQAFADLFALPGLPYVGQLVAASDQLEVGGAGGLRLPCGVGHRV